MRWICACLLSAICLPCAAADDFKVLKLEQDVLQLSRRVDELSRQVDELKQRVAAAPAVRAAPADAQGAPVETVRWLSSENWSRVRPGTSELEVIDILGPPTTMRSSGDPASRTLMYAIEIGSSGFLSGSVQMKDRHVVEVHVPVLK